MKTVLITGGGSGIGFETAKLLMEAKGYRLALIGRNRAKLEAAAATLLAAEPSGNHSNHPEDISIFTCDLRDTSQVEKTVDKIARTFNGIYGLVNNAGVYPLGGISDTTEAAWDDAMAVNLKAPFVLTQAAVKVMTKSGQGGRVVNISSTAGILPNQFALAYSVSKAALIQMSRTLAKEIGKDGITVNCICPGIVRSPLHEAYHANHSELEEFYAKRGASLPIGRVGEPREVASAVRYFLSEDAAWVTGDVFVIDGGRILQ